MHLGTRQNHGGLRFFTFRTSIWWSVINISLLSFKIVAWLKMRPTRNFKDQSQTYTNSLWGVAQNHPRSQKCVRGLKIDLVQASFKTCLASHRGGWKFKKCVSCVRVVKIRPCSKVLVFTYFEAPRRRPRTLSKNVTDTNKIKGGSVSKSIVNVDSQGSPKWPKML